MCTTAVNSSEAPFIYARDADATSTAKLVAVLKPALASIQACQLGNSGHIELIVPPSPPPCRSGACGTVCPAGNICREGKCACPATGTCSVAALQPQVNPEAPPYPYGQVRSFSSAPGGGSAVL